MNELKRYMENDLKQAMERNGVTITTQDIPEILKVGADVFLLRKGVSLPEKLMLEFYLILTEIRGSSPSKTSSK